MGWEGVSGIVSTLVSVSCVLTFPFKLLARLNARGVEHLAALN